MARILHQERLAQNLSMTRLAEGAALSRQMVSYVERGMRVPTLDTLVRMARVLEIDLGAAITKAATRVLDALRSGAAQGDVTATDGDLYWLAIRLGGLQVDPRFAAPAAISPGSSPKPRKARGGGARSHARSRSASGGSPRRPPPARRRG